MVIGSTIGGAVFGLLVGLVFSMCWNRRKKRDDISEKGKEKDAAALASPRGSRFTVDPYTLPSQPDQDTQMAVGEGLSRSASPNSTMQPARSEMMRQTSDGSSRQVYLVHHDGGRPPISVYHPEGADIVELPPSYGPRTPINAPAEQETSLAQRIGSSVKTKKRREPPSS